MSEEIPSWAVQMRGSIDRLGDKIDRVSEDVAEAKCAAQETGTLITGGDRPERGLVMKLDRLNTAHRELKGRVDEHDEERKEIKRESRQAVWSVIVASILGLGGLLWGIATGKH